jgi:hypothetical protein
MRCIPLPSARGQRERSPKDDFASSWQLARVHTWVASALGIALDEQLDAPLDFRRWTLAAAAKELVVLDLELADVFFELRQFLVDRGHGGRSPVSPG